LALGQAAVELVTQSPAARRHPVVFSPDERSSSRKTSAVPRILIVEDDYVVGLDLENGLSEAGFEVVGIANSAAEAVRLAGSTRPNLAIMDVHLAGKRDGVEAALEVFTAYGVRSIFATAHHDRHTRSRAKDAEPFGWLPKPYQLDALISMVNAAIAEIEKSRC
jgi:DNA-binding NarL/FixJ family response regulator